MQLEQAERLSRKAMQVPVARRQQECCRHHIDSLVHGCDLCLRLSHVCNGGSYRRQESVVLQGTIHEIPMTDVVGNPQPVPVSIAMDILQEVLHGR